MIITIFYIFAASLLIESTKPLFAPEALLRAEAAAAQDAAERGDSSFCGIDIPAEWRGGLATGSLSIATVGSDAPLAQCLHRLGYLTPDELAAVERHEHAREWRWWEKGLWVFGLVAVVTAAAWKLLRRRPAASNLARAS